MVGPKLEEKEKKEGERKEGKGKEGEGKEGKSVCLPGREWRFYGDGSAGNMLAGQTGEPTF